MLMQKFTSTLKVWRAKENLTQEELADKVGVARQTIAYIEKGEYVPSVKLAYDLAQIFKCSIEDLFIF